MNNIDTTLQVGSAIAGYHFNAQHPITRAIAELRKIMQSLSLIEVDAPHIEMEEYNFDYLNVLKNHPARGLHDTFYVNNVDENGRKMLLRSHTSNTQIRVLESGKYKVPFGVFTIGRVYRRDQDSTHLPMFHQFEVMILDDKINVGHLKWLIKRIIKSYFTGWNPNVRFRSSYFPFTEPSIEVDITDANGEWREVLGSGMMRSNIMERYGYNTRGIAIGGGLERLCMLKNGISDIGMLYSNRPSYV